MPLYCVMNIGAHVSASGGLWEAPANAAALGCETFQFFSRPPQGGIAKPIAEATADRFRKALKSAKIASCYIHAPYVLNLASSSDRIFHTSISLIRQELERGSLLGCQAVMFHPGSAKDLEKKEGIKQVMKGLNEILNGYDGSCQLLIEISAGAGAVMGDSFEEVAAFINGAERGKEIGVCFDTQHAFASGYDLRTKEGLEAVLKAFDKLIGLKKLIVFHVNDSKIKLGGRRDRHEHLGKGEMGKSAFQALIQHPKLQKKDMIIETPFDSGREEDIALLKSFRKV